MKLSRGLKIGFSGFVIALLGAVTVFFGFEIERRWLSVAGYVIAIVGVAVGFAGIVYGWITEGRQAVTGSLAAAKKLRHKIATQAHRDTPDE